MRTKKPKLSIVPRWLLVTLCLGPLLSVSSSIVRAQTTVTPPPADQVPTTSTPGTKTTEVPRAASAVNKSEGQPTEAKPKKAPFSLTVTSDQIIGLSLTAKDAKLADVAADLSRQLKIPVQLSPVMSKQSVTVDFRDLVLEASMQMLAPEVYIDYQIDSVPGTMPKPLGIFLSAYNEQAPATNAVVQAKSQAIIISGHTEKDPSEEDDEGLQVVYERGTLTVKAKDQLLVDVLFRIAEEMGIPLEADESEAKVTVNIIKTPVEDAILQLAPNIRLFVRADLQRAHRRPLRISLVPTEKRS